jgi:predicted HAD superfamily phosphohydrolase
LRIVKVLLKSNELKRAYTPLISILYEQPQNLYNLLHKSFTKLDDLFTKLDDLFTKLSKNEIHDLGDLWGTSK